MNIDVNKYKVQIGKNSIRSWVQAVPFIYVKYISNYNIIKLNWDNATYKRTTTVQFLNRVFSEIKEKPLAFKCKVPYKRCDVFNSMLRL